MATVLGLSYWVLTLGLAPFFGLMALVTASAFVPRRKGAGPPINPAALPPPKLLIVIPAHDEEANVGATVASCRGVTFDRSRFAVWVIADNCTDETARTARDAGAKVFERHDPVRRSKGYALEDFFKTDKDFDGVVVVDADTVVDPNLLSHVEAALAEGDDWVQCYYTVRNPDASWRTRLLTYAFSLFNGVWLLGQDRLGLGAGFRGNGMGFSVRGLARVPWKAYGLVEDQEFSWTLRALGERVRFLPEARVYGEMVSQGRGTVSQRRRWEEGRRSLRAKFFRPLLTSRALSAPHKALALVDLLFPSLTPLLASLLLASIALPVGWMIPAIMPIVQPLVPIHALMAMTFLLYALSPFLLLGLPVRYLASLPMIPYFAMWKLVATFGSRTTTWIRTDRERSPRR